MFLAIKAVYKDMKAKESFVDSDWKPFLATKCKAFDTVLI